MPRPAVGGPQAYTTGSELLKAMSTRHTTMRTAALTAREMRTKTGAQGAFESSTVVIGGELILTWVDSLRLCPDLITNQGIST